MRSVHEKFGVSTLLFREFSLEKALEKINKTGFKKIDLAIILPDFCPHYYPLETDTKDDKSVKDLLLQYQFEISTLNVLPGYFNKDNPEYVSKFIRRCVEIAKNLGAPSITIPTGAGASGEHWLENVQYVQKYLREEAEFSYDQGIFLSVEAPHHDTLTENVEQAKQFFDLLDLQIVKCTFDTSHVLSGGSKSLVEGLEAIGLERINHIHLRDALGDDISITPGKGCGDFREFFQKINKSEYQGDFIFELEYNNYSEKEKYRELSFALGTCEIFSNSEKLPIKLKLRSSRAYQFFERFSRDPKAEIRRHKNILPVARRINAFLLRLMPKDVYTGKWGKKYRFGKAQPIRSKPQSVIIQKNPEKIYKIGVFGCGWAGMEMHGPGFERLNNAQIIGAVDLNRDKAIQFAKRFHCQPYSSLEELIQAGRPDIVAVCSSEWTHHDAALYSLQNGAAVFCEKLLATRHHHAREMVEAARKQNRVLGMNYNYRFMPGIQKIKEIIEEKALGELCFFNINVHAMAYAHALDLLSFFGGKILTVSGSFKNDNSIRKFRDTDWSIYDDDILYVPSVYASVTSEFENASIGVVNSSYYLDLEAFILSVEAVFQMGALTLNGINLFDCVGYLTYTSKEKLRKVDMNYRKGVFTNGFDYTFYRSIESFMRNYAEGKEPEIPGEQGLFNIELEKAIYQSNQQRCKILMSEFCRNL